MMINSLRAIIAYGLLTINLVVGTCLVFMCVLLRILCPLKWVSGVVDCAITRLTCYHAYNIRWVLIWVCGVELQLSMPAHFDKTACFTLIANHRSLVDILILIAAGVDSLPPLKFFLKRSLMYVPFMGLFCYLTGYPFVDRYSKADLRNPELRKQQTATLLQKCVRLYEDPVGLVIFVEGTRFDKNKASRHKYQHLLPPQSLGLALALHAKSDQTLLDVTLAYETGEITPWQLLSGQARQVKVDFQLISDTQSVVYQDRKSMVSFHKWLQTVWESKDRRLALMFAGDGAV